YQTCKPGIREVKRENSVASFYELSLRDARLLSQALEKSRTRLCRQFLRIIIAGCQTFKPDIREVKRENSAASF
ncbi:hypothetical protein SK128_006272, partial [Halocaridina rubra]